jgi:transcriptional regulator with XRE-family HTH domain
VRAGNVSFRIGKAGAVVRRSQLPQRIPEVKVLIPTSSTSQHTQGYALGASFDVSDERRRNPDALRESAGAVTLNEFEERHTSMLPAETDSVNTLGHCGNMFPFPEESRTLAGMKSDDLPRLMKEWRESNHLTQREAARRAGIHYSYWSKLESGHADAKPMIRLQLQRTMGAAVEVEVRETAALYGFSATFDVVLTAGDIAAVQNIVGPAQAGDLLVFQPASPDETDAGVVLVEKDGRRVIGVVARNPMTGQAVVWLSGQAVPEVPTQTAVIGRAKLLVRRL